MNKGYMSTIAVMAMGIGSMVGAGIFSLMGQAALAAGHNVYLSFLLGGIVALLSGLTYGRLGACYPRAGGILSYFNTAFGPGILAGGLGLIYFATLAITVSMVAQAFGAYGAALLHELGTVQLPASVLTAGIILLLGLLNMMGAGLVGRAETILVLLKLLILLLLLAAGLPGMQANRPVSGLMHAAPAGLLSSVGLTFFAYAGYGMMANAAPNLRHPARQLPLAILSAIGLVMVLYVLLSLIITDQIPPEVLAQHADTAVAQAAAPLLGKAGYIAVSVAALIATASAINATLFSMLRIADALSSHGEIGGFFSARLWRNGTRGYALTLGLCLLMALLLNLAETASIAGATFLLSYLAVYVAHWKLRHHTGAGIWEILPGALLMLVVFLGFFGHLCRSAPLLPCIIVGVVGAGFACEWLIRRTQRSQE